MPEADDTQRPAPDGGSIWHIADPTPMTTHALQREAAALKELIFTRLDAMDKAVELFSGNLTRVPTDVDKQVQNLKELHSERFNRVDTRFNGIQDQFAERDKRTDQVSKDSKVAVDAALQAAKELGNEQTRASALAIAKSETATAKQLDQIGLTLQNSQGALNDKIDDLRTRLTGLEGRGQGVGSAWGVLATVIGIVIAGLAIYVGTRGDKSGAGAQPQVIVVPGPSASPPPIVIQRDAK
jgi:hypothetical protein